MKSKFRPSIIQFNDNSIKDGRKYSIEQTRYIKPSSFFKKFTQVKMESLLHKEST